VSTREREGLIARIRQIRRVASAPETPQAGDGANPDAGRIDALEARLAHLEQLLEGLQDSVHRESGRQGKLIAELQEQIQPGVMGAALSKDARERGL